MHYGVIQNMLSIHHESHICVHSKKAFDVWILVFDGKRFFSTEDIEFILKSPVTLASHDTSVIIEWDRNSMELPCLGPTMDMEVNSSLLIHRLGDLIRIEEESDTCRKVLVELGFREWNELIKNLEA